MEGEPDHRAWRWLRRALVGVAALGFLSVVSLCLIMLADIQIAGNGSRDFGERLSWTIERGDHLHYAGHLVLGRIFDLCPCTRRAADAQYYHARFHATTLTQQAVLVTSRPGSLAGLGEYLIGPLRVGVEWIGDGIAWLRGNRPARIVLVGLDEFAIHPPEIHVLRGTKVIWRNVDQLGEAHTVTADERQFVSFKSDFLKPDEQFAYLFTERGRYAYYCEVHGGPGLGGMSGVVVVD